MHNDIKNAIYAPVGGFGNHLRWLISLDNSYNFRINETEFSTVGNKKEFFLSCIYSDKRTWFNWLDYEWSYRNEIDQHIICSHEPTPNQMHRIAILTCPVDLCLRSYLKFNSNLNNCPPGSFKAVIDKFHNLAAEVSKHDNVKIFRSEKLFKPELDRDFYQELIRWFELDDNYQDANYVHGLWYRSHQRAEKEFVDDITAYYKHGIKYW